MYKDININLLQLSKNDIVLDLHSKRLIYIYKLEGYNFIDK